MKIFQLILAAALFAWDQTAMAACTPTQTAPVWLTRNVYTAEGGEVSQTGAVNPGHFDNAVGALITPVQAVQRSNSQVVRDAFARCNQQDASSIQLTKVWHPDANGNYRTIHVTVRVQSQPGALWWTCHVYAQSNSDGQLTTTCDAGEDANFAYYPIPQWRLKNP